MRQMNGSGQCGEPGASGSGQCGSRSASGSGGDRVSLGYDDIINLPHHVSTTRPHMTVAERAAQFSPFAALTGHGDAIRETARLTEDQTDLDEDMLVRLDEKLAELARTAAAGVQPEAAVTYFEADERKKGGAYRTKTGRVKRVDPAGRKIIFTDRTELEIENVVDIEIAPDPNRRYGAAEWRIL